MFAPEIHSSGKWGLNQGKRRSREGRRSARVYGFRIEPIGSAGPEPIGLQRAIFARLATLDAPSYERAREASARALGFRVSALDEMVQKARPAPDAGQTRSVTLLDVEPWHDAVSGDRMLTGLAGVIRRHVILPAAAADCIALWIAHTWVSERFQHTPRLGIGSPAKRCGKSTLLDVLRATCKRTLTGRAWAGIGNGCSASLGQCVCLPMMWLG